jgi:hypothetical protein
MAQIDKDKFEVMMAQYRRTQDGGGRIVIIRIDDVYGVEIEQRKKHDAPF